MLIAVHAMSNLMWRDLLLLLIGALFGGALNLLVERARVWWRRGAVHKALLPYVKGCGQQARDLHKSLASDMIPNWQSLTCATYYFRAIDTSAWEALLQDLDQVSPKYLTALMDLHSRIASLRFGLDFLQQVQKRFEEAAQRGNATITEAVRKRVLDYAERIRDECDPIARLADVTDLKNFARRCRAL